MSNPTSNFGWQMPTATDLVTDLPADFEVFGQAVDTDFVDLLGGTTGQILSKTSATDLDFTWIANDQGDITGVTAGNGITVTSSTGPVPTVAINTAVTADLTTAQTLTNKTLTSPALTTPTISTLTTNGDLLYGTGSGALARQGIGSTGNVLTVSGGLPVWSAPAGGGKVLQVVTANITTDTTISSTSYTDTAMTITITPTLNTSKILVLFALQCRLSTTANDTVGIGLKLLRDATIIVDMSAGTNSRAFAIQATADGIPTLASTIYTNYNYLDSPATTSATTYKVQAALNSTAASRSARFQMQNIPSVITVLEIGA
jgi:hypothetical protein